MSCQKVLITLYSFSKTMTESEEYKLQVGKGDDPDEDIRVCIEIYKEELSNEEKEAIEKYKFRFVSMKNRRERSFALFDVKKQDMKSLDDIRTLPFVKKIWHRLEMHVPHSFSAER